MSTIPSLKIKGFEIPYCIFNGGMGARVSGPTLAREVSRCGGLGVLSSAGLKDILSLKRNRKYDTYQAVREEIENAIADKRLVGINVMCRLLESYDQTIKAALDAKVSAIMIGAGLPRRIENPGDTALIPIVSSARALKLILRFWRPDRPDAVILEGPMAGGHLGFKLEDVEKPEFCLENILPEVLEVAAKNGNFPVIVAGGIWTKADILKFLGLGASGVQLGTRFLATTESGASDEFKRCIIDATKEDIIVVDSSPCGFPFRILKSSPMYTSYRKPRCDMGYVLEKDAKGRFTVCRAHPNNPENDKHLCICNGLRAAIGMAPNEPPLYTVGSNAYRVKSIISVSKLMTELVEG